MLRYFGPNALINCYFNMLQTRINDISDIVIQHLKTFSSISIYCGFSALTLLVGCQEEHPACKNQSGEVEWLSLWNEVQIVCIWSS